MTDTQFDREWDKNARLRTSLNLLSMLSKMIGILPDNISEYEYNINMKDKEVESLEYWTNTERTNGHTVVPIPQKYKSKFNSVIQSFST
jgi:hypothetical protein